MSKCLSVVLLLFLCGLTLAQTDPMAPAPPSPQPKDKHNALEPPMAPMGSDVFKPTLGIGAGMFSFYGDLQPKKFLQHPSVGHLAYDLTLSQKLNDFLQLNFYVLFGKVGVTEDISTRNANFESRINLGGVNLQYNFNNFLPNRSQAIHPFISLGFEGFEFLSKTDLYDQSGNKYNYWTDGSIKNMAQSSPNAANAINLVRDYKYETDIRESNLDRFGKYTERAFALPVGAGFVFHLGDRVDLKLHTTLHFTTTDYIDGITDKSLGVRKGNSMNDKFMMTGFSLHWDLLGPKVQVDTLPSDWFNNVDFLALETEDTDGDGVRDTADICPGTPTGAVVDTKGCPGDSDADGVLDYADKEPDSKPRAVVDEEGITLSDSIIKKRYLQFIDTTNQFADVITYFHGEYDNSNGIVENAQPHRTSDGVIIPDDYTILLGTYKSGLSQATMSKFLSIKDIETTHMPDSSIAYSAGHYKNYADAQKRKEQSIKDGMGDAKIVYKQNGKFVEATDDIIAQLNKKNSKTKKGVDKYESDVNLKLDSLIVASAKGVVFRIQLGAYSRRLSKTIFKNIDKLIEIHTEDDLYKYITGSFSNFKDAAKAKTDIVLKGYSGAFINAYKDGKRVSLSEVGVTETSSPGQTKKSNKQKAAQKQSTAQQEEIEKPMSVVDKKLIVFKVQIGVFKNEPPADKKAKFSALANNVEHETTSVGLMRYTVGNTNNYNEAQQMRNKMQKNGFEDAFIIAFFNGQYISIQEAIELAK